MLYQTKSKISSYFLLVYSLQKVYSANEAYFECGAHGKFEYCIEGVPDCVVGCHCYPGYYFDTDSKICEPNIKLTQYRRLYNTEPTRVPTQDYVTQPTPTSKSLIDEKLDAIAKDSDGLGDWLYNQFFKTIENQVINTSDSNVKTRRTAEGIHPLKIKRKSHKKSKRLKKKKYKKKGLKSRLMQITEDDSLFDSSSASTSSDSDETDNSSNENSESDLPSDHGHRKILMINKKPTPPLPSFIFLPNVETPFYPPIGLAAPALPMAPMPMYPMIPVPPVGLSTDCSTTTTTLHTSTTGPSSISSITSKTASPETVSPGTATPEVKTNMEPTMKPSASAPGRAGNHRGRISGFMPISEKKKAHRKKLMQRLREKMKNQRQTIQNYEDGETLLINDIEQPMELRERAPVMLPHDGVDFEFLSQLIHKININETIPKLYRNPNPNFPIPNLPTRREYYHETIPNISAQTIHKHRPVSKADEINGSYYTDLGKQIASLIRTLNRNGEHEIDVEIQQQATKSPIETMFNENRYNPQSYWERFVRSPLKLLLHKLSLKNNSDNLINIENQVSMAATVERTLSLQELENIVNQIEYSQTKITPRKNYQPTPAEKTKPKSIYNFNINLLPVTTIRNDYLNIIQTVPEPKLVKMKDVKRLLNLNNNNQMRIIPRHALYKNHTNLKESEWTKSLGALKEMKPRNNFLKAYHVPIVQEQAHRTFRKNVTYPKPFWAEQTINDSQTPDLVGYGNVNLLTRNRNTADIQQQMPFVAPYQNQRKALVAKPSYFDNELPVQFNYFNL